jgi:hypothetical protein
MQSSGCCSRGPRLKQKLNLAVKVAFEAQMLLQQIRLQIAQRDMADVQAKHQRRESLASKIIERRVADLMNGEDLGWQQSRNGLKQGSTQSDEAVKAEAAEGKTAGGDVSANRQQPGVAVRNPSSWIRVLPACD